MANAACDTLKVDSDDEVTLGMLDLMNMTSDASFLPDFSEDDRENSFDRADVCKRIEPSFESPRGLAAWVDIFGDEGESQNTSPLLHGAPDEFTSSFCSQSSSSCFVDTFSQNAELQPTATPPGKRGNKILQAKRERARAETLARKLSIEMKPVVLPTSCGASPKKVDVESPLPQSRSVDRKIRNRASVQRCRAKKLERYETMEMERQTLRKENEALAAALDTFSDLVQTRVANLRKSRESKAS